MTIHRRCLIEHFADGGSRPIDGYGQVRSPVHTHHHFALQLAWAIEEVQKRDATIAMQTSQIAALAQPNCSELKSESGSKPED